MMNSSAQTMNDKMTFLAKEIKKTHQNAKKKSAEITKIYVNLIKMHVSVIAVSMRLIMKNFKYMHTIQDDFLLKHILGIICLPLCTSFLFTDPKLCQMPFYILSNYQKLVMQRWPVRNSDVNDIHFRRIIHTSETSETHSKPLFIK